MKLSERLLLTEDIIVYTKDKITLCDQELVTENINVERLTVDQLEDPFVVKQLKNQLKTTKKWQSVLCTITKLNTILSACMGVGGVGYAHYVLFNKDHLEHRATLGRTPYGTQAGPHEYIDAMNADMRSAKIAILMPLIQFSVSILVTLIKHNMRGQEIDDISMLRSKIEESISLYKEKMESTTDKDNKEKLKMLIDELTDLKTFIDEECDRLTT